MRRISKEADIFLLISSAHWSELRPRVIEQTIRQKLPEGFQRSEFLLEHGMLDGVVRRHELKACISRALDFMKAPAH